MNEQLALEPLLEDLTKQLCYADTSLDFGLYRLLQLRNAAFATFLEDTFLPELQEAFSRWRAVKETAPTTPPDTSSVKTKKARAKKKAKKSKNHGFVDDVWAPVCAFFADFYREGHFLSLSEGRECSFSGGCEEEIQFAWADMDRMYVGQVHHFPKRTFQVKEKRLVHFVVAQAPNSSEYSSYEKGRSHRFYLEEKDAVILDGNELTVQFVYGLKTKKQKLKDINCELEAAILQQLESETWISALQELAPGKNRNQLSLLYRNLHAFSKVKRFDVFFHRKLGQFLGTALERYSRDVLLQTDLLEKAGPELLFEKVSYLRIIRRLVLLLIAFLDASESYQRALFLQKRGVRDEQWWFTLDQIPASFFPEILKNASQKTAWVDLYALDAEPKKVSELTDNPGFVLDTHHFSKEFKTRLLDSFENVEEALDCTAVQGDNLDALRLLHETHAQKVDMVYIDPPYNTEHSNEQRRFIYKDSYAHSSWLSMMYDRLLLAKHFLKDDGIYYQSIGDDELGNSLKLLEFMDFRLLGNFVWKRTRTGGHLSNTVNKLSDYVLIADQFSQKQRLFGGKPDSKESQPLCKVISKNRILTFPVGSLFFYDTLKKELDVPAKPVGTKVSKVEILEPFRIRNETNQDVVKLEGRFVWTQEKLEAELAAGTRLVIKNVERMLPRFFRESNHAKPFPSMASSQFPVGTNEDGSAVILHHFGERFLMSYPKPLDLLKRLIETKSHFYPGALVLDFFAGSGTTGHAAIALNREIGSQIKTILIEKGEHFEQILLPRLQKAVYSDAWKNGSPLRANGISFRAKILRLASFEDAIAALDLEEAERELQEQVLSAVNGVLSEGNAQ